MGKELRLDSFVFLQSAICGKSGAKITLKWKICSPFQPTSKKYNTETKYFYWVHWENINCCGSRCSENRCFSAIPQAKAVKGTTEDASSLSMYMQRFYRSWPAPPNLPTDWFQPIDWKLYKNSTSQLPFCAINIPGYLPTIMHIYKHGNYLLPSVCTHKKH